MHAKKPMPERPKLRALTPALPFWISLAFLPLSYMAATQGGLWVWVFMGFAMATVTVMDAIFGQDSGNPDATTAAGLFWHKAVTWIWLPVQLAMIFGCIWWIVAGDLGLSHAIGLTIGLGMATGGIGIVYAHELMHQTNRAERALAELLMTSVLYGHFVTEHLMVHHRYVGTEKDPATARYNESFYAFFLRVIPQSLASAWQVEAARLAQKGLPVWSLSNPFWRYWGKALSFLFLAWLLAGSTGVLFYMLQAGIAILFLEQINYVEHYGLVRKRLPDGSYEPVQPHHSWNADHIASNFLFINLQRHADHHMKPARRFPLLQTYDDSTAPMLPFGYPLMGMLSLNPYLWRRIMNPRVRRWRALHYPERTDWSVI